MVPTSALGFSQEWKTYSKAGSGSRQAEGAGREGREERKEQMEERPLSLPAIVAHQTTHASSASVTEEVVVSAVPEVTVFPPLFTSPSPARVVEAAGVAVRGRAEAGHAVACGDAGDDATAVAPAHSVSERRNVGKGGADRGKFTQGCCGVECWGSRQEGGR